MKIGKIFGFVRRRGWLMVLGVALGVIAAVLLTQKTLSTYEARATVAVANKTQIPGTTDYVNQPLSKQMADTYAQLITRPIILDEVQKRLNIKTDRKLLLKKITAQAVSTPEGSVSDVSGVRNDPQQIQIKVRDTDPNYAANLANTLAQVFIEDNAGQFVAPGSLRLVEGALVPKQPVAAHMATNAIVGGIVGFYLALLLAFAWEFAVDRVRVSEDVEEKLGLPLLAGVDRFRNGCNILEEEPDSRPATSYRQLRSNLRFLTATDDIKALVLTSANVDEGKSTTATNLAIVLAQGGESVILVDADLRRYEPERQPDVSGSVGLTGLLRTDHPDIPAALVATRWPNLWLLPAGPLPPRPADLLGSDRMVRLTRTLRGMAKYVIFDTPPMLSVPDAALLADQADGTLVITAVGKTRTRSLRRVVRTLNETRSQVLGVVLNKLTPPKAVKPGIAQIATPDLPQLQGPKVDHKALRAEERAKKQAKREAAERAKRIQELQKKVEQARRKNKEQVAAMDTTPNISFPEPIMPNQVELPSVASIREQAGKPVEAFSAQGIPVHEAARPAPEPAMPAPVLPKPIVVETRTTTFVVPAATTSLDTSGLEERLTSLQEKLAGLRSATRADALRQAANAPARPQVAVPAGVAQAAPQPGSPDPRVEELLARLNDTVGLIQSLNKPVNQPGKEEA